MTFVTVVIFKRESAEDVLPSGTIAIWLLDEIEALAWVARIVSGVSGGAVNRYNF